MPGSRTRCHVARLTRQPACQATIRVICSSNIRGATHRAATGRSVSRRQAGLLQMVRRTESFSVRDLIGKLVGWQPQPAAAYVLGTKSHCIRVAQRGFRMRIEPITMAIESKTGTAQRTFAVGSVGDARHSSRNVEALRRELDEKIALERRGRPGAAAHHLNF